MGKQIGYMTISGMHEMHPRNHYSHTAASYMNVQHSGATLTEGQLPLRDTCIPYGDYLLWVFTVKV